MQRLLIMLAAEQPSTLEAELVAGEAALTEIARSAGADVRLAVRLDDDPLTAQAGEGRIIAPLTGLVEFTSPSDDHWGEVAGAVGDVLGSVSDWMRSAVVAGAVHEVLPAASDDLLLVLAANRLPTLDHAGFCDYWLNRHAALAMSLLDDEARRRMGYQQVHVDAELSHRATEAAGAGASDYDGVLQAGLSAIDDLPHLRVPGFAEKIVADEAHFADQTAEMRGAFMRTLRAGRTPS